MSAVIERRFIKVVDVLLLESDSDVLGFSSAFHDLLWVARSCFSVVGQRFYLVSLLKPPEPALRKTEATVRNLELLGELLGLLSNHEPSHRNLRRVDGIQPTNERLLDVRELCFSARLPREGMAAGNHNCVHVLQHLADSSSGHRASLQLETESGPRCELALRPGWLLDCLFNDLLLLLDHERDSHRGGLTGEGFETKYQMCGCACAIFSYCIFIQIQIPAIFQL